MDTLQSIFGKGLTQSQKARKAFWGGVGMGQFSSALDMSMIGFQASKAGRGALIQAIVGQSIAIGIGIPLSGFASVAVSLIPGIGPLAAAFIGEGLSAYAELRFGSALIKKIRTFTNLNKTIRHLEMGGSYQDSEFAQRQRFIAIQDMNASMIPGRRYLGNEALLMHR